MKNHSNNDTPNILNKTMLFSIGILVIVGFIFSLYGSYESNESFNWNALRAEIKDTVKLIERHGSITNKAVGYAGKTPQQWHRRKWLIKNATKQELKELIRHTNVAVKVTAYEGLIEKPNTNKYELIYQALNDTTTFLNNQLDVFGLPMMLGEYLVERVVPISDRIPPISPDRIKKYNLSEEEIFKLLKLYNERMNKKKRS